MTLYSQIHYIVEHGIVVGTSAIDCLESLVSEMIYRLGQKQ